MDIAKLQLLHIQAGKELRWFKQNIQQADMLEKLAADLIDPSYSLRQADKHRQAAERNLENYQDLHQQILLITENLVTCPH